MKSNTAKNESSGLHVVSNTTKAPRVRKEKVEVDPNNLGVVQQARIAFKSANRAALCLGILLGGLVPSLAYCIAHLGITSETPWYLIVPYLAIVGGCLIFSAPTVYQWCSVCFASKGKSFGFVVLIEAALITPMPSALHYLPMVCLGYLVFINSIATGTKCALRK